MREREGKKRERKGEMYADMILDNLGAGCDELVQVDHVQLAVADDGLEVAALVLTNVVVQRTEILARVERIDADAETVGFGAEAKEIVLRVPEVVDESHDADGDVEQAYGIAKARNGHFG
jgi:hypothetical protein